MANEKFSTDQSFWFDLHGGSSWRQAGLVTGGGPNDGYDIAERAGINGEELARAGIQSGGGSIQFLPCGDGWDLITYIVTPDTGVFRALKFALDTGHREVVHDNCYVTQFEFTANAQGECSASFDYLYMPPRLTTGGPSTWDTALSSPWNMEGWEAGITFGSTTGYADGYWTAATAVNLGVQTFTLQVQYPVTYTYDLAGRSGTGSPAEGKRLPRALRHLNSQKVMLSTLDVLVPPTSNLERDYPNRDITFSFSGTTNDSSPKTIAFSSSGMMWDGRPTEDYVTDETTPVIWSCGLRPANKKSTTLTYSVS